MASSLRYNSFTRALLFVLLMAGPMAPTSALDNARLLASATARSPRTLNEAQALLQMIQRASLAEDGVRLIIVNDFFNKHVAYQIDMQTWGVANYWASPLETLSKGAGACTDYSVAKYFSLLSAGVPEAKLRMVYVRVMLDGQSLAHMVVAYYPTPDASPLVLDNINPQVLPAAQRPDLTPVFSFNTAGLWHGVGATTMGDPMVRLSQWRDLVAKVRAEGF